MENVIEINGTSYKLPVVIEDLSNEAYHSPECPGVSKSDLDLISRSPLHYVHAKTAPKNETDAMTLGSLVHCLILEPHKVNDLYAVAPDVDRRTKAGKEEYTQFIEESHGKTIINTDQMKLALEMKNAVANSITATQLLSNAKIETSAFALDHETGVIKKCRPDAAIIEDRILIDLKTCNDASINEFRRQIVNYNYDKQAAYYLNVYSEATGVKFDTFIFICVEKVAPFGVGIYMINDACLEAGEKLFRRDLESYRKTFENATTVKSIGGYPDMVQTIDMATFGFDLASR